jgi:hypothetical protein
MAVNFSGWFTNNKISHLTDVAQTGGTLSLIVTSNKLALFTNTITPDFDAALASARYGGGVYAANEVSGTGWAAGGVLVSAAGVSAATITPTLTVSPGGTIMWDANDVAVASTNLTNARCLLWYADAITAPNADPAHLLVNFGADFSTNNGTFGIQWATTGISALDVTP